MPTLRKYVNDPSYHVVDSIKRHAVTFQLRAEGAAFLTRDLGLADRASFGREHLIRLLQKRCVFTHKSGPGDILAELRHEQDDGADGRRIELATRLRVQYQVRIRFEGWDGGVLDALLKDFVAAITKGPTVLHGPYPLPTRTERYRVVRAGGRKYYEVWTHKRLLMAIDPDPGFLGRISGLSVPPGVDVKLREFVNSVE